jgi:SNF2 family DNA or RNA helicase
VIGEAQERALSIPRPKIRLFADKAIVGDSYREEEIPLVALAFDYGSRVIDADENLAFDFARVRNPRAENDARRILENFGLVDLACLETIAVAPGIPAHYALACEGDVHRYCAFSAYVVPQLRSLGFEVTIDRGYPYDARAGDAWYLEVGEEGEGEKTRDWFNLELGVEIDGRRTNLLPTLLDLLNQHRGRLRAIESAGSRHIAVKTEQGYVSVPRERLKMLFEVLVELHRVALKKREEIFIPIDETSVLRLLGSLGERARFERGARTDRLLKDAIAPKAPPVPPPPGLRAELRPYQAEGLAWLTHLKAQGLGGILADEMGLGKTLQVIAHLLAESEREREEHPQLEARRPSLVIAPTSLVSGWARELARFAPSLKVVILHGHKRHRRREEARTADVVVTTYPLLVRDEEELVRDPYRILVLDEAHTIKNPRSETHRAAQKLVADQRVALSGTPLENHLGELFAIAEFVAPGALGDELGFRRAYRADDSTDRLGALRSRLASFVLRRTKDEVAKDLPPKTEIARPVSLAGRQRDLYEAIRISAHAQVRHAISERGLAASTVSILDALLKLREVCCDPRLVRLNAATTVKESAKLEAFLELVATEQKAGRRMLVFSQFTRMIALLQAALEARGIPPLVLTGQTRDRQRIIDAFEKERAADVFLLSLKAAGVGLTLTSAETVIHYDPWWNPAVQDQATDRAHRIGQKKPVFVHTLFVAGSVEERLLALQERKRRLARAVLDGATDAKMSIEDVDYLFAPLGG